MFSRMTDDKSIALYFIEYVSDFLDAVFVFSDIVTVVVTVYDCDGG